MKTPVLKDSDTTLDPNASPCFDYQTTEEADFNQAVNNIIDDYLVLDYLKTVEKWYKLGFLSDINDRNQLEE